MIARITGELVGVTGGRAYVETGGITYDILVTEPVAHRLIAVGNVGEQVTFHTLHYIEGNVGIGNQVPRLVGFLNETDLEFFAMLITVQGLGVRKALRSLVIPVKDMARAIEMNDLAALKRLPEIGAKTAQKIIVELKGKTAKFALLKEADIPAMTAATSVSEEYQLEAVEILKQLQYTEAEAVEIVRRAAVAAPGIGTAEDLIQEIFRRQAT